ncbi:hypothetical protein C0992_006567 [Termitomyces sp. T32_za158]|nr:hypothetical protein C0992_006567 [Termitomyces sp. T32_za158]
MPETSLVQKRLSYSTQHGSHILGTVMDLAEVEVEDAEDIDEIVDQTVKTRAHASQARAVLAKVGLSSLIPDTGNIADILI